VATPLDWKEVKHGLHPADFRIDNAIERFERVGDLFAPVIQGGQKLENALEQLPGAETRKPAKKAGTRAKA
jgi:bifunctional non-homologous end joining protein LigD